MPIHILIFCSLFVALISSGKLFAQDDSHDTPAATTSAERIASWQLHQKLERESPFKQLSWQALGPRKQGGRIEAIDCDPTNSSVMYVGVGSGGLWKTEDVLLLKSPSPGVFCEVMS